MRWFVLSLSVLFLGLCVLLVYGYFRDLTLTRASLNWPETEGVITGTKIANDPSEHHGVREASYFVYVKFEYRVNGQVYWNSGGELEQQRYGEYKDAVRAVQYEQGDKIPVYYKPTNPKISFLVPGGGGVSAVRLIVAAVIGIIGFLLFACWKAMKGI